MNVIANRPGVAEIMRAAITDMMQIEHRAHASFVRTPLLYPSGATVVVQCQHARGSFQVSDAAFGFQEADCSGASNVFARVAPVVSAQSGIVFKNSAFHIYEVSPSHLGAAIMTVAGCSHDAATQAVRKYTERKASDMAEELFDLLFSVFQPSNVLKHAKVIGYSNTEWPVASLVQFQSGGMSTIFEPVTSHPISVAYANMKFGDIGRTEAPPRRVGVVRRKADLGTLLQVLSQSASVIDFDVSRHTLAKLANAA